MEDTSHGRFKHTHFYSWRQNIRGVENWNGSNFAIFHQNISNDHLKCLPGQDLQVHAKDTQVYSVKKVTRGQKVTHFDRYHKLPIISRICRFYLSPKQYKFFFKINYNERLYMCFLISAV